MIIERQGDLFNSDAKMIGHGINCKGAMRAGIATQFSTRFPDMYEEYKKLCRQQAIKPGDVFYYFDEAENRHIANIASQYRPGPDARYSWTLKGIRSALDIAQWHGYRSLALPRIACGIGGLDWNTLRENLIHEFKDHRVDLEIWSL